MCPAVHRHRNASGISYFLEHNKTILVIISASCCFSRSPWEFLPLWPSLFVQNLPVFGASTLKEGLPEPGGSNMSHVWWDKHDVLAPRSSITSLVGMLVLTAPSEEPHKSSSLCSRGARRSLVISGPERWRQIQYIHQVQMGELGNQRLLRTSRANNWRQGELCIDEKQAKMQILASQIPNQRKKHSGFSQDTVPAAMGEPDVLMPLVTLSRAFRLERGVAGDPSESPWKREPLNVALIGKKREKPTGLRGIYGDVWVDWHGAWQEGGTMCLTDVTGLPLIRPLSQLLNFALKKIYIRTESYCSGCLHHVGPVF